MDVRELKPDEQEALATLLKACGHAGDLPEELFDHNIGLALVAEDGGTIVGLIFSTFGGEIRHLFVSEGEAKLETERMLLDKLLRRMRTRGLARCQIQMPLDDHRRQFWDAVKWMEPIRNDQSQVAPAGSVPPVEIVGDAFGEKSGPASAPAPGDGRSSSDGDAPADDGRDASHRAA